ncbi:DUF6199 family natural product biosynthesis protein [Mycobacterium sp. LTG2003]
MGLAILCLVIGIPIGLYLLLRPRKIWWALESWKYKNPEANEPSEAGYAMQALGGVGVIAAAIIFAVLAWSTESDRKTAEAEQQKKEEWERAVAAYDPPEPEDRGPLPIIGYVEKPPRGSLSNQYDVYYLKPPNAFPAGFKGFVNGPKGRYQCITHVPRSVPKGINPVPVQAKLSWEPDVPQADSTASDKCTTGDLSQLSEIESESVFADPGAALVTDSPIVDAHGTVLMPAKPGNPVPKLDAPPRR